MATRNTRNRAAIAASEDTAPAAPVDTDGTDTASDAVPADGDTADTAPAASVLTYTVTVNGAAVSRTVAPDALAALATAVGAGRTARHARAYGVGTFIADHAGMNANRAHRMLTAAGHYVHRDTVNAAAGAYALASEFVARDALADTASVLADVMSLVDAVGIRAIRGTHGRISVIGYDTLSALTDTDARASEFTDAVHAALSAARNVSDALADADTGTGEGTDTDGPADGEGTDGPDTDTVTVTYTAPAAASDAVAALSANYGPADALAALADALADAVTAAPSDALSDALSAAVARISAHLASVTVNA